MKRWVSSIELAKLKGLKSDELIKLVKPKGLKLVLLTDRVMAEMLVKLRDYVKVMKLVNVKAWKKARKMENSIVLAILLDSKMVLNSELPTQ